MMEVGEKKRVIVYVDGYNLYYGIRSAYRNRFKWLDLEKLAGTFLSPDMELVAVKYFTAITKSTTESKQRQEVYLKALEAYCPKLEFYYGRFLAKPRNCRQCGDSYMAFEEKKTDVNIACQILNDTHLDQYDLCYIVSGDSDLVPPVEIVRANHPQKRIITAHPPERKSEELCRISHGHFGISRIKLTMSLLPEKVTLKSGSVVTRPPEWR